MEANGKAGEVVVKEGMPRVVARSSKRWEEINNFSYFLSEGDLYQKVYDRLVRVANPSTGDYVIANKHFYVSLYEPVDVMIEYYRR